MCVRLLGAAAAVPTALTLLQDLRLVLRMVRRYAPARYPTLVATMLDTEGDTWPEQTEQAAE